MALQISTDEARRFLTTYHLTPTDIPGVLAHLGTVQYDPLNPTGRNPDLVFGARVPGYRVDDWQRAAYTDRIMYDAWDKQACLVPVADWPYRALIRERFHPWHDREILDASPEAVRAALEEVDRRGPLSSLEFEDRTRAPEGHAWYGPTRIKRILRALWCRGILVTHHREGVRHYYDRPERVIPLQHVSAPPTTDEDEYYRWIVLRRHRAAGLLRPGAGAEVWSVCGATPRRRQAVLELIESGVLVPVEVGERKLLFHLPATALSTLSAPEPEPRVVFLGPLDNLIWDRRAIEYIFNFNYIWEVYKKAPDRKWGYYVLPVLYRDRFIGRIDSRLEGRTWVISRWWWEEAVQPDAELLDALRDASRRFLAYLNADSVRVPADLDGATSAALRGE